MEKDNIEGFYPFVFIILFYLVSVVRKSMKKKEDAQQPNPQPGPKPAYKPPPIKPVPIAEKVEEPIISLPKNEKLPKRPRIQKIVDRLHSKKDLFILNEILTRRDQF